MCVFLKQAENDELEVPDNEGKLNKTKQHKEAAGKLQCALLQVNRWRVSRKLGVLTITSVNKCLLDL